MHAPGYTACIVLFRMSPACNQEEGMARALERSRRLLDEDPDLRRSALSPEARERLQAEGLSSLQRFALACELYADRPCLGERARVVEDGRTRALPAFQHITFAELWKRVQAFASGLARLGLGEPGAMVGISGSPIIDGVVADLSCLYLGAVSVPLSTIAPADELGRIVAGAGLSSIACSVEQLEAIAATLGSAPRVRALVMTGLHDVDRAQAETIARVQERIARAHPAVRTYTMAEVERLGREGGAVPPVETVAAGTLRTIVHTSGSTGTPKGAMFPERIWSLYWQRFWELGPAIPFVTVSYMPLNHMAGRGLLLRSLANGGLTSFVSSSDQSTLLEDIRIARPTTLLVVPRLANLIHQRFQTEAMRRAAPGRDAEAEVMAEMRRSFLGDRLLFVSTGAAPTAPEVSAFLARCFDVAIVDGYGSTEAGVIAIDGCLAKDEVTEHVLVDVPELGYRTSDEPYPRGELRVKTRSMVPGYYRSPEATRELFDEEGFLCTGDIVEQHGPDEIVLIDRRKNVLKLAQGEFVSVSRLEELYVGGSPFIGQVYLHGNSLWSYLLAVVVPEGKADKALLRKEIDRIAAREGLRGYEVPRDFLVETAPFTREAGLLTDLGKPSRPKLRERFGEALDGLHADIERRQLEDLRALGAEPGVPAGEKVARAFAATLGLSEREVRETGRSFRELGGDSLGAVELVARVHDLSGVDLPVALVLDPTSSVGALMRAAEERLSAGASRRLGFAEVHGAGAETVRAEDLRLDRFIPGGELATAGSAPRSGPPVVVLTGANGFLGRFLLLDLLERVAPSRGKVVAMVRASDDEAARERLAASYARPDPKLPAGGADPALQARFAALSAGEGRLEVIAADLIRPRLGLSTERWDRLAAEVSAIVHPGALVNHALSYPQLFEPNVLGTVEVMRLALRRRAPIGFVSTAGVAAGLGRIIGEDEDAAALWQRRPVDSGYAVGYSTSKWAGELLMRELAARAGIPVSVFRPSMIMPPRSFAGQVNADDLLTRLLQSLVVTGVAPRSFYAGTKAQRHFDGLPVDVVAGAIAAVTLATRDGHAIYHVVNGHLDDGVSLDTFVGWTERAGYRLQRIDDYAGWLRAFRARLEALDPAAQQRSALAGLAAWERPAGLDLALDNRLLLRQLRALGEPAEMPHVDELAVRRYLESMVSAGLIPPPAGYGGPPPS
jgi:fatty acid CoA ligase FadD9